MKLKASLESVKSRKNVSDDIVYSVTFAVYPDKMEPLLIGTLMTFYKCPIEIEITEVA